MTTQPDDFDAVQRVLSRAVRARCPSVLSDRADDIVQEAMIKIIRMRREGKGSVQPSYLWKVAWSATIDELRRFRRRQEDDLDTMIAEPTEPSPFANPETMVRSRRISRQIADCLSSLLDARRRALALFLIGHTVPETARLLDWSSKKAENSVYRGLSDLRSCLTLKGVTP